MVKALWGHLPERSREQMLQSFSDEFLPKYELEIEQYYRRLSEEQGESQASRAHPGPCALSQQRPVQNDQGHGEVNHQSRHVHQRCDERRR